MFAKIENNIPTNYPTLNLRQLYPHVSLPSDLTTADLPDGWVYVHQAPVPQYDHYTESIAAGEPVKQNGKWVQPWVVTPLQASEVEDHIQQAISQSVQAIDNAAAEVYNRFMPFAEEYKAREAQAQAFKDANYQGDMPSQVAAFAVPAGMAPKQAADLILAQSAGLRHDIEALGIQRMRKQEVKAATSAQEAIDTAQEVVAAIQQIGTML